ncbi:hypothetical protein EWM64_g5847 [Hericium alpestre]|uniref:C3H1-type domain-containing protein n=1 Tax=Hericium alpestre TaxID=135208 RepID=A0A4Y9ZVS5_9AGAM|nr:hypothetical protein EWM64_g5847 [Hericium alpestre]
MVSDLWKASSEGDLQRLQELLPQASPADIEIKVKNAHHDVVKALLEKGASPVNASAYGVPAQYTSDPAILEMLRGPPPPKLNGDSTQHGPMYTHDPNVDPSKVYPMPPPGAYAYYPGMPVPPPPDGSLPYYPQHPPPPPAQSADDQQQTGGQQSNLPPPEIARLIPCRYFPACRYGPSCMFAHPQGPYYQGQMPPPSQYPAPYDQMNSPVYQPNFYPMPPPSFQPNGIPPPHMNPASPQSAPPSAGPPQQPMVHGRVNSEIMSPVQGTFSPNGAPGAPYGAVSPISPSYPHTGPVPVPLMPPLPPVGHAPPPPMGGPQSPHAMYPAPGVTGPPGPPPVPNYDPRRNSVGQYAAPPPGSVPEPNGVQRAPPLHVSESFSHGGHRDGIAHNRRGSMRRPSFAGSRKPPCMFFPSGRDECRFPHVLPDAPGAHQPHFAGRGGRFRPPPPMNGVAGIEEKLANMNVQDNAPPQHQPSSGTSTPPEANTRPRPSVPNKPFGPAPNGHRAAKPVPAKQRYCNLALSL